MPCRPSRPIDAISQLVQNRDSNIKYETGPSLISQPNQIGSRQSPWTRHSHSLSRQHSKSPSLFHCLSSFFFEPTLSRSLRGFRGSYLNRDPACLGLFVAMSSWISEVPWEEPAKVASLAMGHVKQWYSSHAFGQYVLVIIAVFWIGHIVSQLVSESR